MKYRLNPFIIAAGLVASIASPSAHGATRNKAATGTDLALAAAWDTLPGSADIATWGAASSTGAHTVSSPVNWGSMLLSGHAAAVSIAGSQITLASGGANSTTILSNSTQALTIDNNIVATAINNSAGITIGNSSTRIQFSATATTTLNGSVTATGGANANDVNFTIRGGGAGTIGGTLTVDGQLAKGDSGTWTLNGANSIGWITISNGALLGGNDSAFGTGTIYLQSGGSNITLASADSTARNFGNKVDFAQLTFTGTANFGQTSGGTGALTFGELSLGTVIRNLAVNANTSFTSVSGTTGGITKTGAGTLTLSGASSTSGNTTISHSGDGTAGVVVGNASALGTGAVLVNGGQEFKASLSVNAGLTVANALTLKRGQGGLHRAVLGLGAGSDWNGSITVDNTSADGIAVILAGGTSSATASIVSGNIGFSTLGTGRALVLRSGFGKVSGSVSLSTGTVQTTDSSNWEFSNASNTWGALDISHPSAIVTTGVANTLSSTGVVFSQGNGTLRLNNQAGTTAYSQTIAGLSGNVKVGLATGSATLTLNTTADQSSSGAISDGISLVKSGSATQTLTGNNTYTGTTTVNEGKLLIGTSGSLGNTAVTVGGGTASGTPTLAGGGTIGGATVIAAAGLGVVGTHAPGETGVSNGVGSQAFTNTLNYQTGSIFEWDLRAISTTDPGEDASNAATGTYDQVVASGASGSVTGSGAVFKIVLGGNAFTNAFWDTDKNWSDIFSGAGAPSNLATIFTSFSDTGGLSGGDGTVTGRGQFTFTGSTLNWTAVPEPTSALAGLLLATGLLRRLRA